MAAPHRILALFGSAVVFGQERGNIEALSALSAQGCSVLCLIRDETWIVDVPAELDAHGLPWLKIPYIENRLPGRMHYIIFRNPVAFIRANWRFFKIVRRFRPTHIHAFNQLYVLNFLVGLAACRLPMIFRAGDEPTVHNFIWWATWKFVMWRSVRFIANSKFVSRSLSIHGVPQNKITVIYNAPPRRLGAIEPLPALPSEEGICRFAYVGQVSEHKGVGVLVNAFRNVAREYPKVQLLIAGRISDWSGDAWARRLRDDALEDLALKNRIFFMGTIADVPGLLAQSNIHVAPSLFNDPSPNVVMEAKQAKRPSIVFPRGGMPELVQDGVNGFVCAEPTSESLAKSMKRYLKEQGLAEQHGKAAKSSLAQLGISAFRENWLDAYEKA